MRQRLHTVEAAILPLCLRLGFHSFGSAPPSATRVQVLECLDSFRAGLLCLFPFGSIRLWRQTVVCASLGFWVCDPMPGLSLWHKGLCQVRADGMTGAHKGIDGEVAVAAEHFSDAGVWNLHAGGEFGAVDALALHKLEECFDDRELAKFNVVFDVLLGLLDGICQRIQFRCVGDFHSF